MRLEELIRAASSHVDAIIVRRTAVNPLLWLAGLITPLWLLLAAMVADAQSRLVLFCFAAAPILFTFVVYLIFMFRDPDRLQSEEFRIRQQALKLLHKRGGSAEIVEVAKQNIRIEGSHSRIGNGDNA